jgi:8-oxo-dGTP pyrophosphatase MutT (NUDIX family)
MKRGKIRKAIFAVVYSVNHFGEIEYAILKRKHHWKGWEFTKGKIEGFEFKRRAVKREVLEESGLKALKIKRFNVKGLYKYKKELKDRKKVVGQNYTLFSAKVDKGDGKIKVDPIEHYYGRWFTFDKAYKLLTWKNQKKCLKIVNDWINSKR